MANDLELSLRIKPELEQAIKQTNDLASSMDAASEAAALAAKEFSENSTAISNASNASKTLATEAEAVGAKYVYAGQSVFSYRDAITTAAAASSQNTAANATLADAIQDVSQQFVDAGQASKTSTTNLGANTNAVKLNKESVEQLLVTYDTTDAATKKLANDQLLLNESFEKGLIDQQQYERASANIARRNQMLSSSYASLRGQMGNVGFQLQDIAVQAQMGVSPMVILAQQGSQLVSGFNPLAGAIIAVGGAIAGALLPSLINAGQETKELEDKIKDLDEGYKNLTESQRQFLRDQENTRQSELKKEIEEQTKQVEKLTRRYKELAEARAGTAPSRGGVSTMGVGFGPGMGSVTGADEKAAKNLTEARATLDTTTKALAESEKELRRINGEKVEDDKELAKEAEKLVERLKEETETYKLTGEALGVYTAEKLKAQGPLRQEIIDLYRKQEVQKKALEAEREAEAAEKRRANAAETTAKNNERLVKSLEAKANALRLSTNATADAEFKERGLSGALLERARAASRLLNLEKERLALGELQQKLLQAQGDTNIPSFDQFRDQYKKLLDQLEGDSAAQGEQIVKQLFDLAKFKVQLDGIERSFDETMENISRAENSINIQREAGLISEYEARQKIYELHQAQAKKLEELRPTFEALQNAPGDVGRTARQALAALDEEVQRLQATMTLLQSTLRDGLESGLTTAIMGLAQGTMTLRDAIREVAISVGEALAQMAAQAAAQMIVNKLSGNDKGSSEAMKEAARDMTTSAIAWALTAKEIQAAAVSLAAANASGGSGGGASTSGGSWWSVAANAIASYYAADGGYITGPGTTTSDSIPAMLSNKEFVTRAAVVTQPGALDFLYDFNRRGMAALSQWAPVYHNTGGLAGVPAPSMPAPKLGNAAANTPAPAFNATVPLTLNANLIDDPQRMADVINSPIGEQALTILISRNPQKFNALLGNR